MSSLSISFRTGKWTSACLLLIGLVFYSPAAAQKFVPGEGTVVLTDWPDEEARRTLRYDILPFIDTLTVGYEYHVRDGRPALSMAVDWVPGSEAIYRGRRVPTSEVPGDIRMAGLDLRFAVEVNGQRRGTLSVVVDSMVAGPRPDFVEINLPDLSWENVFVDTSPEAAKTIFLNGFQLADLEIAGAAFAVFGENGEPIQTEVASAPRGRPARVSIYRAPHIMDVFVDVNWLIGGFSSRPAIRRGESRDGIGRGSVDARDRDRGGRQTRTEGDRSGRSADGRDADGRGSDSRDSGDRTDQDEGTRETASGERESGAQSGSRGGLRLPDAGDDEDDDDDDELVPYALAAVGAAGILAAVGGTIGYYGSSRHAPLGLTSGFVRRDGGLLLQAAVNEALLFDEPKPKRLMVKLLSFGNFLNSGVQPALGAGVLATSEGDEITYEPTVSIGAVGVWKMMLLYGGYDVVQQGPEFSVALNIRELGLWKSRED